MYACKMLTEKEGKMDWRVGVAALFLMMGLAGCGGGDSDPTSPANPVEAVRTRSRAFAEALVREDLNAAMEFYSERYQDEEGNGKTNVRDGLESLFSLADVFFINFQNESFSVHSNNTRVTHTFVSEVRGRDQETGEVFTDRNHVVHEWENEQNRWRLITIVVEEDEEEEDSFSTRDRKSPSRRTKGRLKVF